MSATRGTAVAEIAQRILLIRGQRVMLDSDLAALYGVSTKRLNQQVKRNDARFPDAFMFRLSAGEHRILRSQIATLRLGHGEHRKYPPNAFTEHGALMLASVLNSQRAIELSAGQAESSHRLYRADRIIWGTLIRWPERSGALRSQTATLRFGPPPLLQ
jgi:ORF6N domain